MHEEWAEVIEHEVSGWPGVTAAAHSRGAGVQFHYQRVELGHLHGSSFADLPFPKKVRDLLIAEGRASVHDPLPDSGWVRRRMRGPDDVQAVIDLFRMNYERAAARAAREAARSSSPAEL